MKKMAWAKIKSDLKKEFTGTNGKLSLAEWLKTFDMISIFLGAMAFFFVFIWAFE